MGRDWVEWHAQYEDPTHPLVDRLTAVRRAVADALDAVVGPVRVISGCAGDGRDLLPLLPGRAVSGRLVELDPDLSAAARVAAPPSVEVVTGDAGLVSAYDGVAPAQVVVFCGIFGNISDADIERTIAQLPRICTTGGRVVWTRHRREPDLTPAIRSWFAASGFGEVDFETPTDGHSWCVGVHRYDGPAPEPGGPDRMFTFV